MKNILLSVALAVGSLQSAQFLDPAERHSSPTRAHLRVPGYKEEANRVKKSLEIAKMSAVRARKGEAAQKTSWRDRGGGVYLSDKYMFSGLLFHPYSKALLSAQYFRRLEANKALQAKSTLVNQKSRGLAVTVAHGARVPWKLGVGAALDSNRREEGVASDPRERRRAVAGLVSLSCST